MIGITDFLLVPITMAFDSMTVGATDGIKEPKMRAWKIILCSFLFGLFQMGMPIIGYFIGSWLQGFFGENQELKAIIVGWIAFSLLMLLSLKSLYEWVKDRIEERKGDSKVEEAEEEKKVKELTLGTMVVQSIATSIDALSIGFVYMTAPVGLAMGLFSTIGLITWILSALAIVFGRVLGPKLERWGDLVAAIVFCLVAIKIVLGAYGLMPF